MKKTKLYILLFCANLFCTYGVSAQSGWRWGVGGLHCAGDVFSTTSDRFGNVFVGGMNITNAGVYGPDTLHRVFEYFIAKANGSGSFLWARATDSPAVGTALTMAITGMTTDLSGNLYALMVCNGVFRMDTFFYSSPSRSSCYILVKYSPTGIMRWAKFVANTLTGYGGVGTDGAGNVYVSGGYSAARDTIAPFVLSNTAPGSADIFVAKFDSSGRTLWAKNFGGSFEDNAIAMTIGNGGDIYITGSYFSDTLSIGALALIKSASYPVECFIFSLDSSGSTRWAKNISTGAYTTSMKTDQFENSYLYGALPLSARVGPDTFTFAGNALLLAKYDSAGSYVWATVCPGDRSPHPYNLDVDSCGNIWFCGNMNDTIDFQGHILHQPSPWISFPTFLAEYNADGSYLFSTALHVESDDWTGVAVDNRGSVYLCGDYTFGPAIFADDTLDWDPLFPSAEYTYIAKYTYAKDTSDATTDTALCVAAIAGGLALHAPAGYTSYLWSTGSGASAISVSGTGTYWVMATNSCTRLTDSFVVSAIAGDVSYHRKDTIACVLSDTSSIVLTAPAGENYHWYDGATGATHIENSPGIYWVAYSVGCNSYVDTFHVTFSAISPPCDSYVIAAIRVKETKAGAKETEIYPNPATDALTIVADKATYFSFTITNNIGRVAMQRQINEPVTKVNVSSLPTGVYYVTLKGDHKLSVLKFAKM